METKICTYDPMSQVSKHLADPAVLNVFDVAPSSIPSRKRAAFVNAVNADARVNKFLHPGNSTDPAYHIEVPQTGTAATPLGSSAPTVIPAVNAQAARTPDSTGTTASTAPNNAVQRLKTPSATPTTTWQNRPFAANIMGSDGDRRIDFTLNRSGSKITGSFAIHGTAGRGNRGNITKGSFDSSDKISPLKLECQFTDGDLVGKTRVLNGWFLYAEDGMKRDKNTDG